MKPVALPPGRAKLSTKPAPTGSATAANTTGTVRVASSNGPTLELPPARMTSGTSAANSAAFLRISAVLVVAQRTSMRRLRPTAQPRNRQRLLERRDTGLPNRIVGNGRHEHADA